MSGYILCQTPVARQPYYITNIQMNIYSMEELCYYLHHNLYLVDQTIMNDGLLNWLSSELGLVSLAQKLKGKLGKFSGPEDFLYPIFKEINYLNYEELKTLGTDLSAYDKQSPLWRRKCRGDAFMRNRMVLRAIDEYELAADGAAEETPEDTQLRGDALHNLGVAYARLFLMDKAAEFFQYAYEVTGKEEEAVSCALAYRTCHTPIEYESLLAGFSAHPDIRDQVDQELERFNRIPEQPVYAQHINEILDRLMSDYHRSMTQ